MPQTISAVLTWAVQILITTSDTPQLDAEILLCSVMDVSRSHLCAWPQKTLTTDQGISFSRMIERRAQGEPVAYLIGHQEFWSLDFVVTPDVLIPRPETELLVDVILSKTKDLLLRGRSFDGKSVSQGDNILLADLGTGSGAIAISIAHERPEWSVYATDQSEAALRIAKLNADNVNAKNIHFTQGSWCHALPSLLFDVIVSNPPYIAEHDIHLQQPNLQFEPQMALVSGIDGLNAIREIILDAPGYLKPGGHLLFEHGYDQAIKVRQLLAEAGYEEIFSQADLSGIERVTGGCRSDKRC